MRKGVKTLRLAKRIGTMLLLLALWIGAASPVAAAGVHSFSIHHPRGAAGAGTVYRVWRLSDADAGKERAALGKELSALTVSQLDQRYPGGFDTHPADAKGIVTVTDLEEGRYCVRSKQTGSKLQDALIDLPDIRDGRVYTHVDAYPKETEKETNGEIIVIVRDGSTQRPLAGVVLDLYRIDPKNGTRTKWAIGLTTDADGRILLSELPAGEYVFVERPPLPGYAPMADYLFRLSYGDTMEILIEKYKRTDTGEVLFLKTDADDPLRALPGASFKVTQKEIRDGKEVYTTVQRNGRDYIVTSGSDGRFSVADLPVGTYFLWETTVPKQPDKIYEPLGVPVAFTVTAASDANSAVRVISNRGKVADSPGTEPPVTEPSNTESPITEPATSEPPVTESPITEPTTSEPPDAERTERPATEKGTSVAGSTDASGTQANPPKGRRPWIPATGDTWQFLWRGVGLTFFLIGIVLVWRDRKENA